MKIWKRGRRCGSRDQDSLYGNEIDATKETNSETCTNTTDIDINLEPGPGGADNHVGSKNQADSATEISKSSSESMKVVPDKVEKNSTGLVGLDIEFLTEEFPSQSDMENYFTRGHIDFPLTLPKDGSNQTFPEGILKFRNINAEQHTRNYSSLFGVSLRSRYIVFHVGHFGTAFVAG